jgi:hypothetical protein
VDFTALDVFAIGEVTIGDDATALVSGQTEIPSTGSTTTLAPFKFTVPSTIGVGVHKVNVDPGGKGASFDLTISLRSVTVTPSNAVPGQAITLSGDGYTKTAGSTLPANTGLTMKAGTGATTAIVSTAAVSIDSTGSWALATIFPVLEATSGSGKSNTIVFTATDNLGLVGVSDSSFKRTTKAVTLSPTTINPGEALTVTVAGFSVDSGSEAAFDANFTVTMWTGSSASGTQIVLTGTSTFPIGSDGTGTGTVTVPTTVTAGTRYITVTDNALQVGGNTATTNNSKEVSVSVPKGAITISPTSVSTGNTLTLTGSAFPPSTTASVLTIGGANALPSGGITTDATGAFSEII